MAICAPWVSRCDVGYCKAVADWRFDEKTLPGLNPWAAEGYLYALAPGRMNICIRCPQLRIVAFAPKTGTTGKASFIVLVRRFLVAP